MIVRIVHLILKKEYCESFKKIFYDSESTIVKFKGCSMVKLYNNLHEPTHFYTYSIWETEEDLNRYRYSEFFKTTWTNVKPLFAEKATAVSLLEVVEKQN